MKKFYCLFFAIITTLLFGQNFTIKSGNFDFLKDQKEVNLQLTFDNVLFHKENLTEPQFLESIRKNMLAKANKTEQDWKKWEQEWESYKKEQFINYFIEGINKKSKKIYFRVNPASNYTLIIETKWIYAGWSGGIVYQPGKLSAIFKFVETNNPSNTLLELEANQLEGKAKNDSLFWEYGRIAAVYQTAGEKLGKEINANTKK